VLFLLASVFLLIIDDGTIPMVIDGVGDYYSRAAGFIGIGCFITFVAVVAFWIGQKKALFQ
jgi:hypothetical protein